MKKSEFIAIRTTEEIKNKLDQIAKEEDRSLSYIVNRIIENYFNKTENRPQ